MDYVLILVLLLLAACAAYAVVRLIIPPFRYVWAGIVLTALSAGIAVFLIGGFLSVSHKIAYSNFQETLMGVWNTFIGDVAALNEQIRMEGFVWDNWETYLWHAFLAIDVVGGVVAAFIGMRTMSVQDTLTFVEGMVYMTIAWVIVLVCEVLLYFVLGVVVILVGQFVKVGPMMLAVGIAFAALVSGGTTWVITIKRE